MLHSIDMVAQYSCAYLKVCCCCSFHQR